MKIWKLWHNEHSLILVTTTEERREILDQIDGRSLLDGWTPLPVKIEGSKRKKRDFPIFLLKAPVVNQKTKALLETYLDDQVEFLPLDFQSSDPKDTSSFYICNVLRIVECVDEEKSIRKYSTGGTFQGYEKIVFDERIFSMEQDLKIFRIEAISHKSCYATDQFKQFLEQHHISGPNFELIWDSEVDYEHTQQKYDEAVRKINEDPQLILSWAEAIELLKQGKCAVSDQWKIKYDANQNFLLGKLTPDLTYEFMQPLYIPPILLDLKWKESDV
ncbi:imm11 family protein [Paenibacillus campi]|uniref:imm11 family protein n=1 Tax=Paenibacillus campi TaxID=3106031 RepID=UPI002AFF2527|nr:DUF1629 domain-containing protein [Paenibacillus sp. SGZ-1014]